MFDWYDLNARHLASAIWLAAFLGVFLVVRPEVRQSARHLVLSATEKHVALATAGLLVVVGASTYFAVWLGEGVSYWVALPVVTTAVWTVGSGMSLLLNYDRFVRKEETFPRAVTRILLPPAVLTALVGASTLSFTLEIVLVPVVVVLVLANAVSGLEEKFRTVGNVCASLLFLYVAALVALLIKDAIADIDNLKLASHAVVVPVWLTLWTVPYLRLVILVEQVKFLVSARRKTIRKSEYGDKWPLTVDKARLCCKLGAVWVEVGTKRYSLNGTSKTILPRYGLKALELEEIWKEDPAGERMRELLEDDGDWSPWRVNIGDLIAEGLALEEGH